MKWVFFAIIAVSVVFAGITGNMGGLSTSIMTEAGAAVDLALTLAAVICLWSGIMRVAQSAGLVEMLSKIFSPLLSKIFRGINPKGRAMGYIVLNLTANLLGLGNAATPFGLAAMRELEREEQTGASASNNMILFVVMNTASLQLIPTTVAALRLSAGSSSPLDILPAVWITPLSSVIIVVTAAKIMGGKRERNI